MDRVSINTTQNVQINYEIANIGDRIVAFLIDIIVLFGYLFSAFYILFSLIENGDNLIQNGGLSIIVLINMPVFLYFLLCEIFLDGQSIGKRARDLKVVKLDGTQASIGNYLIRWLLRPIDYFFGIGILAMLFNDSGQRIGDLAAGTTLIKLQKRVSISDTLFKEVGEGYNPVFPEVTKLSDHHIELINKIMNSSSSLSNNLAVERLAQKTRHMMGVNGDMPPRKFLNTVLKDYNYYSTTNTN